jgi:hypothetical protein
MTTPLVIAPDPLAGLPPLLRWAVARAKPDDEALALLRPDLNAQALYDGWISAGHELSAIRLIAAVLPPRESIWWAWVSARHATQVEGGVAPSAAVHAAVGAVEQWIMRPDDPARRAAWEAGNTAGLDTPIGLVAAAVFMSGTTVGPPNGAPIPPPPGAAMPLIAGAIALAGVANTNPDQIKPTLAAFAAQGMEIVKRLGGWDAALQTAHETQQRLQNDYDRATAAPAAR